MYNKKLTNYAIILASGFGSRYGAEIPKQFSKIGEKTILEHTLDKFEGNSNIDKIILVITPSYIDFVKNILQNNYKKIHRIIEGGELRKDSSYNGVFSIEEKEANVLIHDCARPFVSQRIINDCVSALKKYSAINVAISSTDTIIEVEDSLIKKIPNRENLMQVQTPQCFKLSLIKKAHKLSKNDNNFTDDCGLIIKHNLADTFVVKGDVENFKITYPNDFYLAEKILKNNTLNWGNESFNML